MNTILEYWPIGFFFGGAVLSLARAWRVAHPRPRKPIWEHSRWLCLSIENFNSPKTFHP